jgi:hypothetical protein
VTLAEPPASSAKKPNGFAIYFMVVYSPLRAFQLLAESPTWFPAWLLSIAGFAGFLWILRPTMVHNALAAGRPIHHYPIPALIVGIAIVFLIVWLCQALIFYIAAQIARADARFALAYTAAANLTAITFIMLLVNAIIVATDISHAAPHEMIKTTWLPSLEDLIHAQGWLGRFLGYIGPVLFWYWVVGVIALEQTLKMRRWPAVTTIVGSDLALSVLSSLYNRPT